MTLCQSAVKTELKLWQQQGKNLLALVKLQHSEQGISLHIPGCRCNNWYRVGNQYYANQQAALAAYGALLDLLHLDCSNKALPLTPTARASRSKVAVA